MRGFWPLQSNCKLLGVPENSQVPISGVWVSSSHSLKVGLWQGQGANGSCIDYVEHHLGGEHTQIKMEM
jgi:ribulose kinase